MDRLPNSVLLDFPCGSGGKEYAFNVGDLGSIPGLGRSPGEEKGYPLQYSGLENPMDYIVLGVTKSRTLPSDFHSIFIKVFVVVVQSLCPILCNPMDCSLPGSSVPTVSQSLLKFISIL